MNRSKSVSDDSTTKQRRFDDQVKNVKSNLLGLVKQDPPSNTSLQQRNRCNTADKRERKHAGAGAPLGVQMSKQGLQFGNNADVLKSMIGKKAQPSSGKPV